MKKYIEIKNPNKNVNCLKVEVYYDKGGFSYVSYTHKPRGYYISVVPVYRENKGSYIMESYVAFTGYKQLLLEVKRQSQKQYEKAVEISGVMEEILVDKLVSENGFELAD